ncbi:MAG: TraR/DksA family transcriptional regulator [Myxococcota bacterium]
MTHGQIERQLRHELHAIVNRLGYMGMVGGSAAMAERAAALAGDLVEDAQIVEAQEVGVLSHERLARRARGLIMALERLKAGTYGTCEACGKLITPARLRALPSATTCVTCQQALEDGRARRLAGVSIP